MSCNTKTSLAAVIDAVNAQLNNNYVDRDDPRINQGVFTEPTIRGGLMLDEAAKLDFCGYVTECGQREPFGKQWVDRPLYPYNTLVSYEDEGEIKSRWQDTDDVVAGTEIGESYTTYEETRSLGLQGYTIIDSFELGATITQRNQALRHAEDGKLYRWAGDLPKIVPAGSTPVSSGGVGTSAWLEVSDTALRQEILTGGLLTDTSVTVTANGVGAVPTNLRDVLSNFLTVSRFGAQGGGVDDTLSIQAALNAAATGMGGGTVHATDKQYTSDTVVVPEGVTFYCNLQLRTPQTVLVKVNRDCKIIGKLRGLAAVGDVEKLIHPATDDCHDVYLDVDVSNTSYGVHATHITDITKAPRRWTGNIRAKNITGDGTLRGYGLLCSPAHDFDMSVSGYVIPRHTLYLTNGSSNNDITVMSDTAGYGDVQIAAYDDQDPCMNNNITIHARNMQSPVGDNSYACNLAGKVQGNTINIFIKESPNGTGAVLLRSLNNASICRNNTITIHQDGAMNGGAMVQSDAAVENTVSIVGIGQLTGEGAKALVNVSNYEGIVPEGNYNYTIHIKKIDYDAMGTAMRGVSVAANYALTDIGQGDINFYNSTDVTIKDNTGTPTKIQGWVHESLFRQQVTVPASSAAFQTVNYSPALTFSKKLSYTVVMPTATAATMPNHVVTGFTATQVKILLQNNSVAEETFFIDGVVRGY